LGKVRAEKNLTPPTPDHQGDGQKADDKGKGYGKEDGKEEMDGKDYLLQHWRNLEYGEYYW